MSKSTKFLIFAHLSLRRGDVAHAIKFINAAIAAQGEAHGH